jgi:SNF2 family DNA or RNA helicase
MFVTCFFQMNNESLCSSYHFLLCIEMGLGKTVQALGLILSNPSTPVPEAGGWHPTCTLVVCPKSVISTWQLEIEKFVKPDALRTVVFEGTPNQRSKIIQKVRDNEVDLLLASYNRVSADLGSEREVNGWGQPLLNLFDVGFHRVILDEAQEIRNPSSKKFKGVMQISKNSGYRLALTGTPFVNNPTDIYSLLSFVGLEPWDNQWAFRIYISNAIRDRKRTGLKKLRAALTYVAFRRTKNAVKDLTLIQKNVELCRVPFPEGPHKQIYDYWFAKTKEAFQDAERDEAVDDSPAQNKFGMQIKLRQSCASGALVVPEGTDNPPFPLAPKIFALLNEVDKMAKDEKGVIFSQ